jgi:hypothetical protein
MCADASGNARYFCCTDVGADDPAVVKALSDESDRDESMSKEEVVGGADVEPDNVSSGAAASVVMSGKSMLLTQRDCGLSR